jgi:hypothetical protein
MTQYIVKQATGLKRIFTGHHMMYISQWLKLGVDKLLRFWNANFVLDKGRTEGVDLGV